MLSVCEIITMAAKDTDNIHLSGYWLLGTVVGLLLLVVGYSPLIYTFLTLYKQ